MICDRGRTRPCNLRLRRAVPYPLGHEADFFVSSVKKETTPERDPARGLEPPTTHCGVAASPSEGLWRSSQWGIMRGTPEED